jgi:hypothetical protein
MDDSKEDLSPRHTMLDEERWAERMKPSRQQKLTPQQRRSRAITLWGLRQAKSEGTLESSVCVLPPMGPSTRRCSTKAEK